MEDEIKLKIGSIGKKEFSISAQDIVTGRTCIIAQSGAGKSWMIAVVCEQLCKNNIPFLVIDTEGEFFTLKEKFDVFWVGSDEQCDADISQIDFKDLIKKSISSGEPIVFDVSEVVDQQKIVEQLAHAIYDVASDVREPYLLIVEEADKFIPQSKESSKKLEEIARRGRKRGLGMLIATQRPSLVNKNVLSQCNNQMLGKLTIENDLKAVDLFFSNRKQVEELVSLEPGEFFVMGSISKTRTKIKSAQRETRHKATTPKIKAHKKTKIHEIKTKEPEAGEEAPVVKEVSTNLGVKPEQTVQQISEMVEGKKKKQFLLFGEEEKVSSIDLVHEPLVYVRVKYLGFLKKPKFASFFINSRTANYVSVSNGLKNLKSFEHLIGLGSDAIKLLHVLAKKKQYTVQELISKVHESDAVIKNNLKKLRDANLATVSGKAERAHLYSALETPVLPNLGKFEDFKFKLEKVKDSKLEEKVKLEDVRAIVKSVESAAEIIEYKKFYYPLYKVKFVLKGKARVVYIDAIAGKHID